MQVTRPATVTRRTSATVRPRCASCTSRSHTMHMTAPDPLHPYHSATDSRLARNRCHQYPQGQNVLSCWCLAPWRFLPLFSVVRLNHGPVCRTLCLSGHGGGSSSSDGGAANGGFLVFGRWSGRAGGSSSSGAESSTHGGESICVAVSAWPSNCGRAEPSDYCCRLVLSGVYEGHRDGASPWVWDRLVEKCGCEWQGQSNGTSLTPVQSARRKVSSSRSQRRSRVHWYGAMRTQVSRTELRRPPDGTARRDNDLTTSFECLESTLDSCLQKKDARNGMSSACHFILITRKPQWLCSVVFAPHAKLLCSRHARADASSLVGRAFCPRF